MAGPGPGICVGRRPRPAAESGAVSPTNSIPVADCLVCHGDSELTKEDTDGKSISLFVDEAAYRASAHGSQLCVSCHPEVTEKHPDEGVALPPVQCAACHEKPSETYNGSAHAAARGRGDPAAATCQDCHGSHTIASTRGADSPMQRPRLAATCGACHPEEVEQVEPSVHGQGLAQGERDTPTCTDCHSEHRIEQLRGVSPIRVSEQICSRCHASERINTKYRLPSDRLETFLESYHGLSARFGSTRAANCASCHGAHLILPSTDIRSTIHPSQLAQTCGRCHPGANQNFASGRIHVNGAADTDVGSILNRWVRRVYLGLIGVTIGLFLVHNGLLWFQHALAARRAPGRTVVRMDRLQRLQHALLACLAVLVWHFYHVIFDPGIYPLNWAFWDGLNPAECHAQSHTMSPSAMTPPSARQ